MVPSPLHSLETLEKTEWAGVGIVPEVWGKVSRTRLPPPPILPETLVVAA